MTNYKLLLTSSGISNDKIKNTLVELLGKPLEKSSVLFVPTAIYPYPQAITNTWQVIKGPIELGWKTFGILELTALPNIPENVWLPQLQSVDVIFVGGGNKFYLSYWMQKSGLFGLLPGLLKNGLVYIGVSAGSMMVTQGFNFDQEKLETENRYYDDEFEEEMTTQNGSAKTLNLVDFVIRPHLNADYFPQATVDNMKNWAGKVKTKLYALDDHSAIKVQNGLIEVISEGNNWKLFE